MKKIKIDLGLNEELEIKGLVLSSRAEEDSEIEYNHLSGGQYAPKRNLVKRTVENWEVLKPDGSKENLIINIVKKESKITISSKMVYEMITLGRDVSELGTIIKS